MDDSIKSESDKRDGDLTSDAEMMSAADDTKDDESNREQEDKPKKKERKRRKRELDKLMSFDDDDGSQDDDSDNENHPKKSRDQNYLSSPGPYSPGHSGTREPRSCVLSQRQKKKPLSRLLEQLLKNLEKRDQNQFFAWPVTDNIAPNYSTIIKRPMDFLTIKQKIDDNEYKSLNCFINDFRLMCNNAMKYNKTGTVYHKAAKKLLHIGLRQLQPAKLRPLGNILTYMYEIPIRELGFDMGKMDVKVMKHTSYHEGNDQKDSTSGAEDDIKIKMEAARERHRKKLAKKAFRRMDALGYTSLNILVDNDGVLPNTNQKPISLGAFVGKLTQGTGTLPSFKEDRRNLVKGVKPLNYGAFGSYAPAYDSTFATLSKEDCHLLYHTYGEEVGIANNESLLRFSPDSPWSCIYNMEEMFPTKTTPSKQNVAETNSEPDHPNVKIDIDQIKSLSEIGIDVEFLTDIEEEIIISQKDFGIKTALMNNLNSLRKLENEQRDRLSQPVPPHLSMMLKPSLSEQEIARAVLHNLKEMTCKVQPQHVAHVPSIRKAMGITLDHLDTPLPLDEFHEESISLPDQSCKESVNADILIKVEDIKQEEESGVEVSSELKQFISEFSTNGEV